MANPSRLKAGKLFLLLTMIFKPSKSTKSPVDILALSLGLTFLVEDFKSNGSSSRLSNVEVAEKMELMRDLVDFETVELDEIVRKHAP